jgi:lactoylglutathione lyase
LRRDAAELAVTTKDAPRVLGPRHELFVYVSDVDETIQRLREAHATVIREPIAMPWGERVAYISDPEGNLVSLANAPAEDQTAGAA